VGAVTVPCAAASTVRASISPFYKWCSMAFHQSVQSGHGVRSGRNGGIGSHQENEQQQHSPLWKYVTKIGKKEKNTGGSCLWNCNKCKTNVTGSYTRVKAHFLWLEGDNGIQHC
jgi:hypothetical protein